MLKKKVFYSMLLKNRSKEKNIIFKPIVDNMPILKTKKSWH